MMVRREKSTDCITEFIETIRIADGSAAIHHTRSSTLRYSFEYYRYILVHSLILYATSSWISNTYFSLTFWSSCTNLDQKMNLSHFYEHFG